VLYQNFGAQSSVDVFLPGCTRNPEHDNMTPNDGLFMGVQNGV